MVLFMAHRTPIRTDEFWMRRALNLARRGLGLTTPNPAVGAVLVHKDKEIGSGFHLRAGSPHAEVIALANCRRGLPLPPETTLYVTLEPCSTHGRTPPCTEAIMRAKPSRVVIGTIDPNPAHAGRGIDLLRASGLEVQTGVLESECRGLNRAFNKWIVSKIPWVIAKAAFTLDGRLALVNERWLSSVNSRKFVQKIRAAVDAIVVGRGTILHDDPQLTVRSPVRPVSGQNPWRIILEGRGSIPKTSRVLNDEFQERTLCIKQNSAKEALQFIGKIPVLSVLLEGGGSVLGSFIEEDLIDEIYFCLTPHIGGGPVVTRRNGRSLDQAKFFPHTRHFKIGNDVWVHALRDSDVGILPALE